MSVVTTGDSDLHEHLFKSNLENLQTTNSYLMWLTNSKYRTYFEWKINETEKKMNFTRHPSSYSRTEQVILTLDQAPSSLEASTIIGQIKLFSEACSEDKRTSKVRVPGLDKKFAGMILSRHKKRVEQEYLFFRALEWIPADGELAEGDLYFQNENSTGLHYEDSARTGIEGTFGNHWIMKVKQQEGVFLETLSGQDFRSRWNNLRSKQTEVDGAHQRNVHQLQEKTTADKAQQWYLHLFFYNPSFNEVLKSLKLPRIKQKNFKSTEEEEALLTPREIVQRQRHLMFQFVPASEKTKDTSIFVFKYPYMSAKQRTFSGDGLIIYLHFFYNYFFCRGSGVDTKICYNDIREYDDQRPLRTTDTEIDMKTLPSLLDFINPTWRQGTGFGGDGYFLSMYLDLYLHKPYIMETLNFGLHSQDADETRVRNEKVFEYLVGTQKTTRFVPQVIPKEVSSQLTLTLNNTVKKVYDIEAKYAQEMNLLERTEQGTREFSIPLDPSRFTVDDFDEVLAYVKEFVDGGGFSIPQPLLWFSQQYLLLVGEGDFVNTTLLLVNTKRRLGHVLEAATYFGATGLEDLVCAEMARVFGYHFQGGKKTVEECLRCCVDAGG